MNDPLALPSVEEEWEELVRAGCAEGAGTSSPPVPPASPPTTTPTESDTLARLFEERVQAQRLVKKANAALDLANRSIKEYLGPIPQEEGFKQVVEAGGYRLVRRCIFKNAYTVRESWQERLEVQLVEAEGGLPTSLPPTDPPPNHLPSDLPDPNSPPF